MAAADPGLARFGARTHRYAIEPRLTETEIRAFEEFHGIALPAEYRSFVAEVGDGPAGPAHGLMPLVSLGAEAAVDDERAVDDEWAEDRRQGRLSEPFPLTGPLPGRIGAPGLEELTSGTLMLAEEGCAMFLRLILNGPYAGEVWRIDPDWGGFTPVSPGFRAWYGSWLASR
ncbi:SMI1/KNR4 family protein [Streptomyces sp. NPDC060198]|uniref:SMI1/KNR4 family protein n=1 Tax=Streptomyces sp. NPDC060198 TaxID=3347070 RepID=UPI0036591C56